MIIPNINGKIKNSWQPNQQPENDVHDMLHLLNITAAMIHHRNDKNLEPQQHVLVRENSEIEIWVSSKQSGN